MTLPKIRDYTLIKPIGQGGMADVYLAIQESIQREVAIKLLTNRPTGDHNFGQRFVHEARISAQLQHPNIVPVYDARQEGDLCYIVMEFLPLGDFKERLESGTNISDGLKILTQILMALEYANSKSFVHRDIKPENILFRNESFAALSDFGIARSILSDSRLTLTGTVMGTPQYMSPEQAQGTAVDGRSDLYSLGIILFELLTGTVPYSGDSAISTGLRHITEPVPRLSRDLTDFQKLIDKALAKSPDNRYQTAREFINAILKTESKLTRKPHILAKVCPSQTGFTISQSARKTMAANTRNSLAPEPTSELPAKDSGGFTRESLRSLLTLIITFVFLIGGGSYLVFRQDAVTPSLLEDRLDQKTSILLQKAIHAIDEKRYFEPAGNNAQDYLNALLTIAPGNPEAKATLEELTRIYINDFTLHIKAKATTEAREDLARAIDNRDLITNFELTNEINELSFLLSQHETELRVKEQADAYESDLTQRIEQALKEKKFLAEASENPINLAHRLLLSNPESEYAQNVLAAIALELSELAESKISLKQFPEAQHFLNEAKRADPSQAKITIVSSNLAKAINGQAKRELKKGRELLQTGNFQESYQLYKSMRLSPAKKTSAAKLLGAIEKTLITEIKKLIASARFSKAQQHLSLAKQIQLEQIPPTTEPISAKRQSANAELEKLATKLMSAIGFNEQNQQRISDLLIAAKSHLAQGKYFEPTNQNAFDSYSEVLKLDSTNTSAASGLALTANTVINKAKKLIADGDFSKATALLQPLLNKLPEKHPLQSKVAGVMVEASAGVIQKANQALNSGDFITAGTYLTHLRTFTKPEQWQRLEARIKKQQITKYTADIKNTINQYRESETGAHPAVLDRLNALTLALESAVLDNTAILAEVKTAIANFYAGIINMLIRESQLDSAAVLKKRLKEVGITGRNLELSFARLDKEKSKPPIPTIGVF